MYVVCGICGADASEWRHDHKPDQSGLDDGPLLPRASINRRKRDSVVNDWKDGATLRDLAAKYQISHETVRAWTEREQRDVGASRRPHR